MKKKYKPLSEFEALNEELKSANRFFFMALSRRSNAQKALKLYYEAHPELMPEPVQMELFT